MREIEIAGWGPTTLDMGTPSASPEREGSLSLVLSQTLLGKSFGRSACFVVKVGPTYRSSHVPQPRVVRWAPFVQSGGKGAQRSGRQPVKSGVGPSRREALEVGMLQCNIDCGSVRTARRL
jgi:hypothetical protein